MENPVLAKLYGETTKEVTAPSGVVYTITAQSSADYLSALGFVPSLRKALAEGTPQDPLEFLAFQQAICSRCVRAMRLGDVSTTEVGDAALWPKDDVAFLFSEIQKILSVDAESSATARELL